MASSITTDDDININYPIIGVNNSTQGFRDNFKNIQLGLTAAKTDITRLDTDCAKITKANNFNGNLIMNAKMTGMTSNKFIINASLPGGITYTNTNINFNNGHYQIITIGEHRDATTGLAISGPVQLNFINWLNDDWDGEGDWPVTDTYCNLRLAVYGTLASNDFMFKTQYGGRMIKNTTFPATLVTADDSSAKIFEFWTCDGGKEVFAQYLGLYRPEPN